MQNKIELFLLILSSVYIIRFIIDFLLQLREENPKTIQLTKTERILMYLSITYIITYILT